jgi:hypothetical protein
MRIISLAIGLGLGLGLVSLAYAQTSLQGLPDCAVSCPGIIFYIFDLGNCMLIGHHDRKLALRNSQQEAPSAVALHLTLAVSVQALTS